MILIFIKQMMGILFFLTMVDKVTHWKEHKRSTLKYNLLPQMLVSPALAVFVFVELYISGSLLIFQNMRLASLSMIILVLIYTGAVIVNLIRGNTDHSCGCGSVLESERLHWGIVLRNGLLIGAGVLLFIESPTVSLSLLNNLTFLLLSASLFLILSTMKTLRVLHQKKRLLSTIK